MNNPHRQEEPTMRLTPTDLHFVLSRLPHDIRTVMKNRNLILAGGFIRSTIAGEKPSDIDLFGASKADLELGAHDLKELRPGARKHNSRNAFTVLAGTRLPAQFIYRWVFSDPEACILSFDFTVCQAGIWYDHAEGHWTSCCAEDFYVDLAARRLVYTAPKRMEEAGGSLLRVRKFLSRGWNIQAPSLAAVIARLVTPIAGSRDEESVAGWVGERLLEVDPLVVIDGVELSDEHEHDPNLR
jgi:hypothetical protein